MLIYLQHKISVFFDMEKRRYRKFIRYFLFNWLSLISLNIFAQDMIKPIDRPVLLSGNFGELRATHFHSGIDIRTGGVEGLPVVCVKDGKVVRVSVSPTGYGQVLYVEHEDGTTTVYGHLQRFNARITALVRQIQYEQESFKIDEEGRDRQLIFQILSAPHNVYPCLCFVLIKPFRPIESSFSRIRVIFTLRALSSTYN